MNQKSKLNWSQRLLINRGTPLAIGKQTRPEWNGSLMFYAFKCPNDKHGIVTDYPHNEYEPFDTIPPYSVSVYVEGKRQRLDCPKCKERINVE